MDNTTSTTLDRICCIACALVLAVVACFFALSPSLATTAYAVGYTASPTSIDDGSSDDESEKALPAALKGETDIEKATIAYKESVKGVEDAEDKIAELQIEINEVEAVLPEQEARSNAGMKQRYIMQSNPMVIADSLMESQTLEDFLKQAEYLERASRANLREYNKTLELKARLDAAKSEQERVKAKAQEEVNETGAALLALQMKRAEKHAEGVAKSQSQAIELGGKKSIGVAYDGGKQDKDYKEAASAATAPLDDGIDWTVDRDEFLAEWTERIDDYLEGSALEGQGKNFAASAWKYCIDPRWSPAISNTESGKGAICIRAHNAWGWGASDEDPYNLAVEWGSWEEAIDSHIRGLSEGYGYTISIKGAQMYCPITWQSWYNKTLDEMKSI